MSQKYILLFVVCIGLVLAVIFSMQPKSKNGFQAVIPPTTLPSGNSTSDAVVPDGTGTDPAAPSLEQVEIVIPVNSRNAIAVEKQIAANIASRDKNAWTRMQYALLDLGVPREDAIRIAKKYLNHPDPMIRYAASETLYIVGDRSGAEALIQIARNPARIAVDGVDSDLRAWAAMTLAKYRETRGIDAVAALYPDIASSGQKSSEVSAVTCHG